MVEADFRGKNITEADILIPKEDWDSKIDALRMQLGAPENPDLFPPHFLKKTLPSIGGHIIEYKNPSGLMGVGFIFPRRVDGQLGYTLRLHTLSEKLTLDEAKILAQDAISVGALPIKEQPITVVPYVPQEHRPLDPGSASTFVPEGVIIRGATLKDGQAIRSLHREVWDVRSDDFLYPADIHSSAFSLPTTLIATVDSAPVGFLFGFDKFSTTSVPNRLQQYIKNKTIRQESQLMGVREDKRGIGIASSLKWNQAHKARSEGTEIINWTYDPLLFQNAQLNINGLRGIVWEHTPNYYAFSGANKLNQVAASRFRVDWLISSPRVESANLQRSERKARILQSFEAGNIPIINSTRIRNSLAGNEVIVIEDDYLHGVDSLSVAIEIPVDWISVQAEDLSLAMQWRNVSDALFQEYVGHADGKYLLTDLVEIKKNNTTVRAFLIGRASSQIERIFSGQEIS